MPIGRVCSTSTPPRSARAGLVATALGLAWLAGAVGCSSPPPPAMSPEDAYLQLLAACDKDDGALLFDALDTHSQWAIQTIHKSQQEMRQLIRNAYPAEMRAELLAGLPAAADEPLERSRRYYRRLDGTPDTLKDIKRRLYLGKNQPVGSTQKKAGFADVWREGGSIFHFARDEKGRWGFNEQTGFWERARERAQHDLDMVRKNADDYRRVAAGQPPAPVKQPLPNPLAQVPQSRQPPTEEPAPAPPTAPPTATPGVGNPARAPALDGKRPRR